MPVKQSGSYGSQDIDRVLCGWYISKNHEGMGDKALEKKETNETLAAICCLAKHRD